MTAALRGGYNHSMTIQYRIVVIDDLRTPKQGSDGITVELHRSLADGLAALKGYAEAGSRIDELWLDHDLGESDDANGFGFDTIMPLVEWLEEEAYNGRVMDIGHVFVHTSNWAAAPRMVAALKNYYSVTTAKLPLADVQESPGTF